MGQLAEFASNHPFLVLGLVATLALVLFNELRLRAQGRTHVSPAEAVRLINKGAVVIDVRPPEAFSAGHIVNSRNLTLAALEADGKALQKYKNKILLTVCDNGTAAAKAATLLRKAGYEKTFSLKDGLRGWQAQSLPLVK